MKLLLEVVFQHREFDSTFLEREFDITEAGIGLPDEDLGALDRSLQGAEETQVKNDTFGRDTFSASIAV